MARGLKDSIGEVKSVRLLFADSVVTDGVELKHLDEEGLLITTKLAEKVPDGTTFAKVVLYCSNGVFVFTSDILRIEENFPYLFWYLTPPVEFEVSQQREFFRTRFNLGATLTIIFNNGEKIVIECNTFDISGSGTSLMVSPLLNNVDLVKLVSRPTINEYAKIGLCLHFEGRDINTKVEFVHKRKLSENSKTMVCAFKFVRINPTDCDFITKQCFSKQLLEQNKSKQ